MRQLLPATVGFVIGLMVSSAHGEYVPIFGGPGYDETTGSGYKATVPFTSTGRPMDAAAQAVGTVNTYLSGTFRGERALRWDISGNSVEVGTLGTDSSGFTKLRAWTLNSSGQLAGYADKYTSGVYKGFRAARWESDGTIVELGNLGTGSSGSTTSLAFGINNTGQVVGRCDKYDSNSYKGTRAVRWSTNGSITELANLGTESSGVTFGEAYEINEAGQAAGWTRKHVSGVSKGSRAVRWDSSGTALELGLGTLGTDSSGFTNTIANAINDAGVSAGYGRKYISGSQRGLRAVRWDSNGVAFELGHLGTDASGFTESRARRINNAGQAMGHAYKYVAGVRKGYRAVRWDSSGIALELANLGEDSSGSTNTSAYNMNDLGQVVGLAPRYDSSGVLLSYDAVYWKSDGSIVNLNDIIDPSSGWHLEYALGINNDGWITGTGSFDPDGPGGLAPYKRWFLLQIPEPGSLALLGLGGVLLLRRGREPIGRRPGAKGTSSWGRAKPARQGTFDDSMRNETIVR